MFIHVQFGRETTPCAVNLFLSFFLCISSFHLSLSLSIYFILSSSFFHHLLIFCESLYCLCLPFIWLSLFLYSFLFLQRLYVLLLSICFLFRVTYYPFLCVLKLEHFEPARRISSPRLEYWLFIFSKTIFSIIFRADKKAIKLEQSVYTSRPKISWDQTFFQNKQFIGTFVVIPNCLTTYRKINGSWAPISVEKDTFTVPMLTNLPT